jgi:hypothetical protein
MNIGAQSVSAIVEAFKGQALGIIVKARGLVLGLTSTDRAGATQQERSHRAAAREWRVSSDRHQGGAGGKSDD